MRSSLLSPSRSRRATATARYRGTPSSGAVTTSRCGQRRSRWSSPWSPRRAIGSAPSPPAGLRGFPSGGAASAWSCIRAPAAGRRLPCSPMPSRRSWAWLSDLALAGRADRRVVVARRWPCDHDGVERRALARAAVTAAHRLTWREALLLDGELLLADHLGPFAGLR